MSWGFIILGIAIFLFFLVGTKLDGYGIFGSSPTNYETTAQFGDFIGGVVGTIFALVGTILIFLTFSEQANQNKREAFESAFFEMMRLHRENVTQLNYKKYNLIDFENAENRKVFRIIYKEFLECYREVKKYSNSKDENDYILIKHKQKLKRLIKNNNLQVNIIEFALIDIAYSIVFFGVGEEGEIVLRDKFKKKYNHIFFYGLLRYIKLKPKKENKERWEKWTNLLALPFKDYQRVNREFYLYRKHHLDSKLSYEAKELIFEKEFEKYYNGHQHRLGHYFRHLFQSYKYLNYHEELNEDEKYFYGKMLRAQLSTYEQALLFVNSISSMGLKWEYLPELELLKNNEPVGNCKLISRYNLIKNLQGNHSFGLTYKKYFPNVKYENEEQI